MKLPKMSLPKFGGRGKSAPVEGDNSAQKSAFIVKKPPVDVSVLGGKVIRIGKGSYAVSLSRHLRNERFTIAEQAKELPHVAGVRNWDLYMSPSRGQITFGSTDIGHKKGHTPLAESLDQSILGDNWVVGFRIGAKSWWVAAGANGRIVEDILVKSDAEARDVMASNVRDGWNVYASPALEVSSAMAAEVWDLMGSKPHALRKIGFLKNNASRIILFAGTAALLGGMWLFYQGRMESLREQERQMAEANRNRVTIRDEDFPWYRGYRIDDFLNECVGAMERVNFSVIGWTSQPLTCSYDGSAGSISVTAGYARGDFGRIADIRAAYDGMAGSVSVDDSGQSVTYRQEWPASLTPGYFSVSPWEGDVIQRVVRERFVNLGIDITLQRPATTNINARNIDKPAVFSHSASLVTNGIPFEEIGVLGDVPAIVPENLVWNPSIDQWGINFDIYHPAILPEAGPGSSSSRRGG